MTIPLPPNIVKKNVWKSGRIKSISKIYDYKYNWYIIFKIHSLIVNLSQGVDKKKQIIL